MLIYRILRHLHFVSIQIRNCYTRKNPMRKRSLISSSGRPFVRNQPVGLGEDPEAHADGQGPQTYEQRLQALHGISSSRRVSITVRAMRPVPWDGGWLPTGRSSGVRRRSREVVYALGFFLGALGYLSIHERAMADAP